MNARGIGVMRGPLAAGVNTHDPIPQNRPP
jgi:hypothetical protein